MVYLIIEFMHVTSDTSPTVPNGKAIEQLIMEILWHFITGGGGGGAAMSPAKYAVDIVEL